MANGYAEALLRTVQSIAQGNTPSEKITATGFLKMLIEKGQKPSIINEGTMDPSGHVRDMRFWYRTRGTEQDWVDTDDCDVEMWPVRQEFTTDLDFFTKGGIYIPDEQVARYEKEASTSVKVGLPATDFMQEHFAGIMAELQGFFQKVNKNLLGAMATEFGVNVRTGLSTPASLNINKSLDAHPLGSGPARIFTDIQENEMNGRISIVGDGLFNLYNNEGMFFTGPNQFGFDRSKVDRGFDFYYDPNVSTKWGSNEIGVFAPGSIALLERNKYVGFRAGERPNSFFFTMQVPVTDSVGSKHLSLFKLDCQLKYYDCPTEVNLGYYDTNTTIDRGWVLFVSKPYGLFVMPDNLYRTGDRLAGVNGALNYTITNNCETC